MTYRRDITGLRGLAVLLVIAYHANASLLSGGYVGVDIFFVISGFVITQLLTQQVGPPRPQLADFFLRRLRRILPALVVVLGATLAAGFFILGPYDLQQLAKSVVAVSLFVGNFFFWRKRNYFADQAPPNALLHTWSIGVEEQFYLLFPLFILLTRQSPRLQRRWMLIGGAVSLLLCVWLTADHPAPAFYLLPTRSWEFLLGGVVAVSRTRGSLSATAAECAAGAGLVAILVSAGLFTGLTPYPGIAAILPCGGAALIIRSNITRTTFVSRILAWRGLVGIGLVSYSAYLWHWPMLTLYRNYVGRQLTSGETCAAISAVAVLSFLSWKFVEQPFRKRSNLTPLGLRTSTILMSFVCLMAFALVTLGARGFPKRISAQALAYEGEGYASNDDNSSCLWGVSEFVAGRQFCTLAKSDGPRLLLWGDSHAHAISPAVAALGRASGATVWEAAYTSCPPLLGVDIAHVPWGHRCREFNAMVLDVVSRLGIQRVILAAKWTYYVPRRPDSAFARLFDIYSAHGSLGSGDAVENQRVFDAALARTVTTLVNHGVEVWIVQQAPVEREYVPVLIARTAMRGGNPETVGVPVSEYLQARSFVNSRFVAVVDRAHLLDPSIPLCASGICICFADGHVLYTDANHLSWDGAMYIKSALMPVFH